jgi:hypothetical protein
MRKTVARKVNPVDNAPSDGSTPDGDPHWYQKRLVKATEKVQWDTKPADGFFPRFAETKPGTRLTAERLEAMLTTVKGHLSDQEAELLGQVLLNREMALAWDFTECGRIDHEIIPPQVIRTIPHSAWQSKSIPIPKPLLPKVIDLLRQRIQRGIIEEGHGSYRNNWFLVLKKDGGLRLINDAQKANKVTIRDAFTPPAAEEFSEDFGGCKVISLLDLFSGYDQVTLDEKSRDLTTFSTPIGLFRMCTLPMGGTNSVAQFQRAMTRIFQNLIPDTCRVYLDDISIKGPRTDYGGKEVAPGIRQFVFEHLQNIDQVLLNAELAGATIAAVKSQWAQPQAVLLGYLCTPDGRLPDQTKVRKVTEWGTCRDLKDVRAFVGLVGYYRVWIRHFAIIAMPLYALMKKDVDFVWSDEAQKAMDTLKEKITTAPVLAALVFDDDRYGLVYLMTDASLDGWGGVIEQIGPDGKRHPCRFESGVWSDAEKRYDATKRELRGLLYLLKRFRRYLFGIHFVVETDALVLVHQLNGAASDIPGALMMRWIAWIRHFDFEVKHIPGRKNAVADALSRKPPGLSDQTEKEQEGDIDDWVDAQIFVNRVQIPATLEPVELAEGYSEHSRAIARYLTTLREPLEIKPYWRRRLFKKEALKHFVDKGHLWLRPMTDAQNPRRIVDSPEERQRIFVACHDQMGHKGREATYRRVTNHYYWKGMYRDVEDWIRRCEPCQKWDARRFENVHLSTMPSPQPFAKWHLDIQYLPSGQMGKKNLLVEARCDLIGYPEADFLPNKGAAGVRDFIRRHIFLRWGLPLCVVVDGGSEFKAEVSAVLRSMGVQQVVISAYNPRANGVTESGHISIAAALAKMTNGTGGKLKELLPYVLFADRTTIRGPLGKSPFFLAHNFDPIDPIENDVPTWRTVNWDSVVVRPDVEDQQEARLKLLTLRAKVLFDADHAFEIAAEKVAIARAEQAERRNEATGRRFRPQIAQISEGDLVLVYDNVRSIDMSSVRKLQYRWQGPFRVKEIRDRNAYVLETLDGVTIATPFAAHRVKKFFKARGDVWLEADGSAGFGPRLTTEQTREDAPDALVEREVEQEVPNRPVEAARLVRQTRSKSRRKSDRRGNQELVVEIPQGKPPGF